MKQVTELVKKVFVGAALVGVLGGAALAARIPMAIDDSFDYTDTSGDPTNLALSYVDGELVFHFGAAADSELPAVDVGSYPRFADSSDVPADEFLVGELPTVDLDLRGDNLFAARFSHEADSLSAVVDAYVARLSDLGFTATLESSDGNVVVYQFTNGDGSLRGVFNATATGADAYLAASL